MDDVSRAEYEAKCQSLRQDLKNWENAWAKENAGKKPGRADIKNNPDIAHKYKSYQKYRDIIDGKIPPPPRDQPARSRKRKSDQTSSITESLPAAAVAAPSETPSKRSRYAETPSKSHFNDEHLQETPTISRKLFSPAAVTSLGPTPQRDGRVLGLFEFLGEEEEKNAGDTPSKPRQTAALSKVQSTPSKRTSLSDVEVTPRMGRTPMSDSKRQYLNTFMSPLKNRDANMTTRTPSKLHFDTPQFLKRHINLATVDENGDFDAPAPLRLPRKPLGRGLSEIVASLRQVEEEKADEDLEALREMEAADGMGPSAGKTDDVLVRDSQISRLPLGGFDDEGIYDSPVEDEKDRDGNPLRIFKKKGQKRTTRKLKIKPVFHRRPENEPAPGAGDSDEEEVVPKTQLGESQPGERPGDLSSDSEFDEGAKSAAAKKSKAAKKKPEGPVKKAARKVNELAHANFHRLKLKQGGAKGGPGYNSRFRRRR